MTAHDPGVSRQFVVDRSNDGVDRLYRVVSGGSLTIRNAKRSPPISHRT